MPGKSMIDKYAESLVAVSTRYRGRSMATRSSEVSRGEQLVGYGMCVSEASYAELDPDRFEYLVTDIWLGAIDEPPGTDLPDACARGNSSSSDGPGSVGVRHIRIGCPSPA